MYIRDAVTVHQETKHLSLPSTRDEMAWQRVGFVMHLKAGNEVEYKVRLARPPRTATLRSSAIHDISDSLSFYFWPLDLLPRPLTP